MDNLVKKAVKKSRDRFLAGAVNSIRQLDSRVGELEPQIESLKQQLADLQKILLETSQNQSATQISIIDKLNNSGTVRLSKNEIVTKIFSGLKIYLDPRDISVTPHLALDSSWEFDITKAWLKQVNSNQVVLDIGANFGYFGVLAAQKIDKENSKVILFEANPQLIPYINKTIAANWLNQQTVVENLAISDQEEKVKLNILEDYIGSSSLHDPEQIDKYMHHTMKVETRQTVEVQATTIDQYCKRNGISKVDLVKMDIEGYEEKAYRGMRHIIKESPGITLFIEFTKDSYEEPKKFFELMMEDFGNLYLIDADGRLTKPKDTSYEKIINKTEDWVMPVFSKNAKLSI